MTRQDQLNGRVVKHLEEIAEQRESFDRVSSRLTKQGYIAAWDHSGTHEQIDLKGSIERAYEQMVNDLQGMLELVELEAHALGLVPDPRLAIDGGPASRQQWWSAASSFGWDVAKADQSLSPGRWRRFAFYGYIDHDLATVLLSLTSARDRFQHRYARRASSYGSEAWGTMDLLRARLEEVVAAILAFRDACLTT